MNVIGVGGDAKPLGNVSGKTTNFAKGKVSSVIVRPLTLSYSGANDNTNVTASKVRSLSYVKPAVKYLMFTFNFIFWLGGMMVMAAGIWIMLDTSNPIRDALDVVFDPAIVVIICGCILFLLAFFGCIGSLRENITLLKTYYYGLIFIVFAEFLMAFSATVVYNVPSLRRKVRMLDPSPVLKAAIIRYHDDENMQAMIDAVQRKFKCCGFTSEGYKDWGNNPYYNCSEENKSVSRCGVPYSCCKPMEDDQPNVMCGYSAIGENAVSLSKRIYLRGCLKGVGVWLELHMSVVGGLFIAVMIPEVMAVRMSKELVSEIESQKQLW